MRRNILVVALFLVAMFLAGGCGSLGGGLGAQLPETVHEACAVYEKSRPQVIELRNYAVANWDSIPPNVQAVLWELDRYLPELDQAGKALCVASGLLSEGKPADLSRTVDWDRVLSTVLKAAVYAAEAKNAGII